ncbi:ABC-F family ATP-binding cassette domain-containing protein [Alkalicella caledoniensis]|uniref:ABC-F family ATP-binding cassette domain-containing protein n=1 Tax=Alkalicella caledoniensis TaxID=2731377 RepID=A0A7G9W775_ALKCA|nr:ABC-F family ATP-binding cassette domain-containing protein [Alkalicella caledoniensis]QNO14537.1 ABC-F family ATP-binding cassette domain-containing protein [Alkalicella caledoniensis]
MIIMQANGIDKYYSGTPILLDVSLQLLAGEKVALVGVNGSGKTTLFNILNGTLDYDKGQIFLGKEVNLGLQKQSQDLNPDHNPVEELTTVFRHLLSKEENIRELELEMASEQGDKLEKLLERYSVLTHEFEEAGGYRFKSDILGVLRGLGFSQEQFTQKISTFSGGQQSRISLGKLLLSKPELLFLDEPTNHLDIDGVQWLEGFLKDYNGAVFVISHDRQFLDNVVSKTYELENSKIKVYQGNYTFYAKEKKKLKEQMLKEYEKQQDYIEKTEDFIRRNIAGQKTKLAQSRRKTLEKLERVDVSPELKSATFEFDLASQSGRFVVTSKEVRYSYGSDEILKGSSFVIERGERVSLVGPNGCGKSTLLNLIAGLLPLQEGELFLGHNVQVSYFSQQRNDLNENNDLMEEIWEVKPQWTQGNIRSYLARFLFTQDDVFKRVSSLSGGEQSRLALAKLILNKGNFLILDEPTNHLDIDSKEVLEDALLEYPGTILVVSHDRYFLNKITDKTIELKEGLTTVFLGNYGYYIEKLQELQQQKQDKAEELKTEIKPNKPKLSNNKEKSLKKKLDEIQQEIEKTEQLITEYEELLCSPDIFNDHDKNLEVTEKYKQAKELLDQLYSNWEEVESELSIQNI